MRPETTQTTIASPGEPAKSRTPLGLTKIPLPTMIPIMIPTPLNNPSSLFNLVPPSSLLLSPSIFEDSSNSISTSFSFPSAISSTINKSPGNFHFIRRCLLKYCSCHFLMSFFSCSLLSQLCCCCSSFHVCSGLQYALGSLKALHFYRVMQGSFG